MRLSPVVQGGGASFQTVNSSHHALPGLLITHHALPGLGFIKVMAESGDPFFIEMARKLGDYH